ncbi:MAG: hypothetical protein LUC44_06070 [Prevotellaceae bacterium]|nr:hypothetical protein [Prevotellaceae bacterium]
MTKEEIDELERLIKECSKANETYRNYFSDVNARQKLRDESIQADKKLQNFVLQHDIIEMLRRSIGYEFAINERNLTAFLENGDFSLNLNRLNALIKTIVKICNSKSIKIQKIVVTRESGGCISNVSLMYEY